MSIPMSEKLTFSQACEYLGLSPDEIVTLREQGLIICQSQNGKQVYPKVVLDIAQRLLKLGRERSWEHETLAWYADLIFATEVGRAVLLPITNSETPATQLPTNWLATQHTVAVLNDLKGEFEGPDGSLITLLRSFAAVGEGQFWTDLQSLKNSALHPIISFFEAAGIPILEQRRTIARDAGPIFVAMLLAFIHIAPPISQELGQLARVAYSKLKGPSVSLADVPVEEQTTIVKQTLVAVDKLYASRATEIHSPPGAWEFKAGVLVARRRTIALEMRELPESALEMIDNIIDIIRPYVGPFGARIIHLLYETANDSPYWRNPLVTIDTNEFLDKLGIKRDKHGYHRSDSRERLRDTLNAAHYLEIVGEYTAWEDGKQVRKALRRTVLSLIGATFDAEENKGLSTAELFQHGLPKTLQIRLNFYDGVRRPDGRLGNQYVLMPRLAEPQALPSARHSATEELLKAYLLSRYRQTRMENQTLTITRGTALEKAGIKTKNVTWATRTLTRALDKLVTDGIVEKYSPIPLKVHQSFTATLTLQMHPERHEEHI